MKLFFVFSLLLFSSLQAMAENTSADSDCSYITTEIETLANRRGEQEFYDDGYFTASKCTTNGENDVPGSLNLKYLGKEKNKFIVGVDDIFDYANNIEVFGTKVSEKEILVDREQTACRNGVLSMPVKVVGETAASVEYPKFTISAKGMSLSYLVKNDKPIAIHCLFAR